MKIYLLLGNIGGLLSNRYSPLRRLSTISNTNGNTANIVIKYEIHVHGDRLFDTYKIPCVSDLVHNPGVLKRLAVIDH